MITQTIISEVSMELVWLSKRSKCKRRQLTDGKWLIVHQSSQKKITDRWKWLIVHQSSQKNTVDRWKMACGVEYLFNEVP